MSGLCLAALVFFGAASAPAALRPATPAQQQAFLTQKPGQPPLDGALFPLARRVQDGCELPCAAPPDVAAYLKEIDAATEELGLSAAQAGRAKENYAPQGIPRKRPAGPAGAVAQRQPVLAPGLGARLGARAQAMAAALGQTRYVSGDSTAAQASAASVTKTAFSRPEAKPAVVVPAPLDPAQVEARFGQDLDLIIGRYPTGQKLLDSMKTPPRVAFKKVASPSFNSGHEKGSPDRIVFNTLRCAEIIGREDPAGAGDQDLTDPKALRQYLAGHPDMIGELAGRSDVLYVHELTHAAQYRRQGQGWLDDQISDWVEILNGRRYPIEKEWEAFGAQNQYLLERAREDPSILRLSGPHLDAVGEFIGYVDNLSVYRKEKASISYERDTATLDHMVLHSDREKAYYAAALGEEQKQWPKLSVEGFLLLARSQDPVTYPGAGLNYLKTAYDRAAASPDLMSSERGALSDGFKTCLAGLEQRLALAEQEKKPWMFGQQSQTLIEQLEARLQIPLPPRIARALGQR